jgi:beta-xylosidase
VKADDGIRVFVDGKAIIEDWKPHGSTESAGKLSLTAGEHDLRVEYFQLTGDAVLSLEWQPPGGTRGPIPVELLKPLADAPVDDKGVELGGPRPTFSNPVVPFDCPDPGLVSAPTAEHPRWVMVCTGGPIPVRVSDDLVTWRDTGNFVIPGGKAPWSANGGRNWAPEIHKVGAGWVAYFTAVDAQNRLAIGCSYASAAEGPYTDCGGSLIEDPQGVIDPTFFEDTDGKRYIYFKLDGNAYGNKTPIYVHELAPDGHSVLASSVPKALITNDLAWEGGIIEAPLVVKHDEFYYLFYSGNAYDARYRTGVARATSPKGPFTKKGDPILGNNASWVGPGHGSVVAAHGKDFFFHHAWPTYPNGALDGSRGRIGVITPIEWVNGWPVLGGNGTVPAGPMPWP